MGGAGIGGDAVEIFSSEKTILQRSEADASDLLFTEHICETVLNPAIQHGIIRLLNETGGSKGFQRVNGDTGLLGAVV